jgi:hypothetical protein
LIFIWYDLWQNKTDIILSKITHICQISKKIHARKTIATEINKVIAEQFLKENHLNEPVSSNKRIGLVLNDDLIALATFGKKRRFRNGTYSGELCQFTTKNNIHINGGLSKLIKHYQKTNDVQSLMTYIDLDWSNGEKFNKSGFVEQSKTNEFYFQLDKDTFKRLNSKVQTEVFNLGNIKATLQFSQLDLTL